MGGVETRPGLEDLREESGVETDELVEEIDIGGLIIRDRFRIQEFCMRACQNLPPPLRVYIRRR